MKKDIHPKYYENVKITCQTCGTVFIAGSTKEDLKTEICSACHPFYTGKRRIVDTEGRVDKFLKRLEKAKTIKEDKLKKVKEKQAKIQEVDEIEKEIEEIKEKRTVKEEEAPKSKAKKTGAKKKKTVTVKKEKAE